jgi:hypothetical protein
MGNGNTDVGVVARYFLRRYAQARRNPNNANAFVPYSTAAFEVSLLFVGLPAIAIFSALLITSLKWAPPQPGSSNVYSARYFGVILFLFFCGVGHWYFFCKFRRYREDPSASAEFDSEADRRIIYRQKFAAIVLSGLVIPLIAFAIAVYWLK